MQFPGKPLIAGFLLFLLATASCSKVSVSPPPLIIHSVERFPFQNYMDSLFSLNSDSIILTIAAISLYDQLIKQGEVPGQAEVAYAFRTSAPASIADLALLLPSARDTHTVTLWDSASGAVLAQANITMVDSGRWVSVPLISLPNGHEVPIQPGRGYIIGFNTLANGNAIDVFNPGNMLYILYGIYDFKSNAPPYMPPVMPFTNGLITYEGMWVDYYDTPITAPIFPGGSPAQTSGLNGVFGVVDFGYIPGP